MYGWLCISIEKAWASVFPSWNRNNLTGNNTVLKDGESVTLWRQQLWKTTTCTVFSYTPAPWKKAGTKSPFLFWFFHSGKYFCYMLANWLAREGPSVKVWGQCMKPWLTVTVDAEQLEHTWSQLLFSQSPSVLWMQSAEQWGTQLLPAVLVQCC